MKVSADILLLLKKYAKGELNDEEQRSCEHLLLLHPELREELELTRSLIQITEKAERERLLHLIQEVDAVANPSGEEEALEVNLGGSAKQTSKRFLPNLGYQWWKLGIAASVLLIAAVVWLILSADDRVGNFISSNYVVPEITASWLVEEAPSLLKSANQSFQAAQYQQSLDLLSGISPTDSLYPMALFLKGHNYYKLGNYQQAIAAFDAAEAFRDSSSQKNLPNWDNLGWTRILAMLSEYNREREEGKKKELNQALQQFRQTSNPADDYHEKANTLKSLMDETSSF